MGETDLPIPARNRLVAAQTSAFTPEKDQTSRKTEQEPVTIIENATALPGLHIAVQTLYRSRTRTPKMGDWRLILASGGDGDSVFEWTSVT